jgi:hypothetical protein
LAEPRQIGEWDLDFEGEPEGLGEIVIKLCVKGKTLESLVPNLQQCDRSVPSKLSPMSQVIQQFLRTYPAVFPLTAFLIFFIYSNLFGSWARLAKSYQYTSSFGGQAWKWQGVILGSSGKSQPMTIGINSVGLYLRPALSIMQWQKPILIPWAELEIEKDQRWIGTLYHFRSAAHPRIKITINDALFGKIAAAAGDNIPLRRSLQTSLDIETNHGEQSPPTLTKLSIQRKLIAKIFAFTFAIGLSLGLINHGIARYQVFVHPASYQIYNPGQYQSLEYGKEWPDSFMEFLGLSQSIYVKVEKNQGAVVSETYYSIFGSTITANYAGGKWQSTGGSILSAPLYMINCVIPLVLGWITIMLTLSTVVQRNIGSQTSPSVQRLNRISMFAIHAVIMGGMNFLGCYWIAALISMSIRVALGESIRMY